MDSEGVSHKLQVEVAPKYMINLPKISRFTQPEHRVEHMITLEVLMKNPPVITQRRVLKLRLFLQHQVDIDDRVSAGARWLMQMVVD